MGFWFLSHSGCFEVFLSSNRSQSEPTKEATEDRPLENRPQAAFLGLASVAFASTLVFNIQPFEMPLSSIQQARALQCRLRAYGHRGIRGNLISNHNLTSVVGNQALFCKEAPLPSWSLHVPTNTDGKTPANSGRSRIQPQSSNPAGRWAAHSQCERIIFALVFLCKKTNLWQRLFFFFFLHF